MSVLVLPWPRLDDYGSLVFEDRGPARRLRLQPRDLSGGEAEPPQAGAVYAARLAGNDEAGSPFATRPIDVTADVRTFARRQAHAARGFSDC